ncbi:MAG: D-alanine--D-alanine ligase [Candidatus Magasanikbacteria bacterium]
MTKKLRLAVLMGGPSAEREISLVTGKAICEQLNKKKYDILPLFISKENKIFLDRGYYELLNADNKKSKTVAKKMVPIKDDDLTKNKIDMVFIALHGTFGEDGTLQGMLEAMNLPYTGSKVLASALAMNKVYANQVYFANGLPFPQFIHFKKDGWKNRRDSIIGDVSERVGYPCVLKPVDQGSAVGVSIVKNEAELLSQINKSIKKFPWLMVQKFVVGKEATCGVIEKDGSPIALPPTRIIPNLGEFYDYKSKYKAGGSTHVCPADFPGHINHDLQELALKAHIALGCKAMSRTDIFVGDDGGYYILETNTIPGMTKTSLLPEAAKAAGIPFDKMLDYIIKASKK